MQRVEGFVQQGGEIVMTAGVSSLTKVQQSFPSATVNVYLAGTLTHATIYADNASTPLANPFTANSYGFFFFYAANGRYDVAFSGGGLPAPWTLGDVLLADPASGPTSVTSVTATGAGITAAPNTGAVIVANTGVTSLVAGLGITVNQAAGPVTVANAWGTVPTGLQLQYLRVKPNVPGTVLEFAPPVLRYSVDFDFPKQAPPENLSPSLKTVTLTPVPLGINGTNATHYVGIYNNAGVWQENALINGGSAVANAGSGTLTFSSLVGTYAAGSYKIGTATAGIQEAIWDVPLYGSVYIPAGAHDLYAMPTVPASKQVAVWGAGIAATALNLRFAAGDGLLYDATTFALVSLGNFRFDPQVARTSGYDLHVKGATFGTVENIFTRNTLNGFEFENCNSIQVHNLQVQTFTGNAFFLNASAAPTSGGFYSHLSAVGLGVNAMLIQAAAGCAFAGTTISDSNFQLATNLINLFPNGGTLNEFLFSNIILDTWGVRGMWFQGGAGSGNGVTIRGVRMGSSSGAGFAIGILSKWSNILIDDITGGASGQGILLSGAKNVQIANTHIAGDGSGAGGNVALTIGTDGAVVADAIKVVNSSFGLAEDGTIGGGTSTVGISVSAAAHTNLRFFGNTAYGNGTAGTASFVYAGTGAGCFTKNNNFIGHTPPAVASAAAVTFPAEEFFTLTGNAAVTAVSGLIAGQSGMFIPTHATPGTWTAGATIGNTFTPTTNKPVKYVSLDGVKVYLS